MALPQLASVSDWPKLDSWCVLLDRPIQAARTLVRVHRLRTPARCFCPGTARARAQNIPGLPIFSVRHSQQQRTQLASESQRQLRNARKAELLPAIRTHESFLPIAKAKRLIPAMPNLQAVHPRSDQPDLSPGKWVVAVRHRRRQNANRELQL